MAKKDKEDSRGQNRIALQDFLAQRQNRMISLWADTGLGKSDFLVTAPQPLFLFSVETDGPRDALKNAYEDGRIEGEEVYIDEVLKSVLGNDPPMIRDLDEETKVYEYMLNEIQYVLKTEKQGTLGIDTGTTFWTMTDEIEGEAIREKRRKQGRDLYQHDYRYANRAFRHIFDAIRHSQLNAVISHHSTSVYSAKGQETKRKRYSGNKRLPEWVDVSFRLQYDPDWDEKGDRRWAEVDKCRIDARLLGTEIDNPTFASVITKLEKKRKRLRGKAKS